MLSPRNRRRSAWVATFAILLNAFAPSLAHALAAHLGVVQLEICTQDGLKRIAVDHRDMRPDIPPGAHVAAGEHCLNCATHGASSAHTPPAATTAPVVAGPASLALDLQSQPAQLVAWTSARARAPPPLS